LRGIVVGAGREAQRYDDHGRQKENLLHNHIIIASPNIFIAIVH
jgi:hypothetical protein